MLFLYAKEFLGHSQTFFNDAVLRVIATHVAKSEYFNFGTRLYSHTNI